MSSESVGNHSVVEDVGNITFSPPLYRQRYDFVASVLREAKVTSVVDFGCAECRTLLVYRDVDTLKRIVGVDIDRQLLLDCAGRLKPRTCDYVFRRSSPLTVELYHGSVAHFDERLLCIEAISLIELIEHLHEPVLSELPATVFGCIAPQLVIVTTPNVEFNVLFPKLTGFRHPDHKFEWTRQQFEEWCNGIAVMWNYSVEFGGVGNPPDDWAHVGHCSQSAVFRRQQKRNTDTTVSASHVYEQLLKVDFPLKIEVSTDDAILHEAEYYIHFMANAAADDIDTSNDCDADDIRLISLRQLLTFSRLQDLCHADIILLRRLLVRAGFQLTADEEFVIYTMDCNKYDDDVDDDADADYSTCTSGCCDVSSELDRCHWDLVVEEDWN